MKSKFSPPVAAAAVLLFVAGAFGSGCVFDIVSVKQMPSSWKPVAAEEPIRILQHDVAVPIGTGFKTKLKKGTRWQAVGRIEQGTIYATRDQVVTVEASHIHEAQPVITDGRIVGFYLPVERTFAPASAPVAVEMSSVQP